MAPWLGSTFYTVYVQKVKLMFSKRSLSESTQSEDKDMKGLYKRNSFEEERAKDSYKKAIWS